MSLQVGTIVEGKVTGITSFGAFVDLSDGKTGLVHISEVAREYVKDIQDFLKEGQEIKVKVLSVEANGKVSLSIKKALEETEKSRPKPVRVPSEFVWDNKKNDDNLSFEDRLSRFKQDSDDRIQDVRKNTESKRGGYRRSSSTF